jgi:hypothetical protein
MKKLLLIAWIAFAATTSGCLVYPWYDGYYEPGYYGGSYGYAGPSVSFYYSNGHGGHGSHYQGHGSHHGGGPPSGGHGSYHRR